MSSTAAGLLRLLLILLALLSALVAGQEWLAAPKAWQPAGLTATAVLAPLSALLLVIVLPAAGRLVLKPKRVLHDALLVVACGGVGLAVAAGHQTLALFNGVTLLVLLAARPLWRELSDRRAERQGWLLLGGAALVFAALFLLEWPSALFKAVGGLLMLLALTSAVWGFWLLTKNAPLPLGSGDGPVAGTYTAHAQAGVSPFTLMRDKTYFWSSDHQAYLAYACRADVALVLGPAVGPAASVARVYREFRTACRQRGWRPAFYQVSEDVAATLGGPRKLLGSEAIVELRSLSLEGPTMAKLRHEVSRGRRNGVTISVVPQHQVDPDVRAAMCAVAETWSARHRLGEMAFSVGRHSDRPDAPTLIGLAHQAGRLVAYCTWLRIPAAQAIVLDEIRRTPDAPAGTMDLLLYSCLDQLRAQAGWASLGLAPLAGAAQATRLARLEATLLQRLGIQSASASLFSFKGKYLPRWEPRYLVAERMTDWPAVALATFLAHYPAWNQPVLGRVPGRLRLAHGEVAAAASFALLLLGLGGIVAAAALSREGHPLYAVRAAVHAQTGLLASTAAPSRSLRGAFIDPMKPAAHVHRPHRLVAHPTIRPYHGTAHRHRAPLANVDQALGGSRKFRKQASG